MRILLIGEGLVEPEYRGDAWIALPAREDAVGEHEDLCGLGREIPTVPGEAVQDGLKRLVRGLGGKIAAPVASAAALPRPNVGLKDPDLALGLRVDDELRQFGSHAVQAVDDGRN